MQLKAIVTFLIATITLVQAQPIEYDGAARGLDAGAPNGLERRETRRQQCRARVTEVCDPIKVANSRAYCFRNGMNVCNGLSTDADVEIKAGPVDVKAGGS